MSNTGRKRKQEGPSKLQQISIEYKGETKNILEWAKETKINCSTIDAKYKKFLNGLIPLEEVFIANTGNPAMSTVGCQNVGKRADGGLRVKAVESLFESFNKHGLPKLDTEVKEYIKTGEMGNAMKFFIKMKDFFPKEKIESLDGDTSKNIAQLAVVFANGQQPSNFTVIDV